MSIHDIIQSKVSGVSYIEYDGDTMKCFDQNKAPIQVDSQIMAEAKAEEAGGIKAAQERRWRDQELSAVDIIVRRLEFDEARGDIPGNIAQWNGYAEALRNYPQSAGFPETERPNRPS